MRVITIDVFFKIFKIWVLEKFEEKMKNGIIKTDKFLDKNSTSNLLLYKSIIKAIIIERK